MIQNSTPYTTNSPDAVGNPTHARVSRALILKPHHIIGAKKNAESRLHGNNTGRKSAMPATTRLPDAIKACRDTESGNRIRRNTTYDENKAVRNHSTLLLSVMSTTCPGESVPGYRQNLEYAIPAKACGVTSLPTAREYSRHTALSVT